MNSLTGFKFSGRKQTKQSEIKKFKLRGLTSKVILAISMSVLGSGASLVALSGVASATSLPLGGLTYSLSEAPPYVATVTGCDGIAATVAIPSTITDGVNTYSVTSIGDSAFYEDYALTSITIPDTVTSIGDAFENDYALTSITIPNSVTSIGDFAFNNDTVLASVTIGNSVTSIGGDAFANDTLIASVSFTTTSSVTSIGNGAFENDTDLTSITIPNSVTTIGDYAFADDTALTSITIPNSVTSIGQGAFLDDTSISFINPTDYVATWTGAGVPYTTAYLMMATDIGAVTGTWASVVRVAPIIYSKPTAPSNVTASLSNGTATVSFTPGSSGNLATYDEIDMYINGQLVGNVCNVSGATSCPIANLGPDAAFSFTVTAINSKGSAVSTVSNTVSYSSPAVVTTTSTSPPTTTTTSPPTTTTTVPPVKRTITCVKGKISKKVTAVSPVCPAGYKKK